MPKKRNRRSATTADATPVLPAALAHTPPSVPAIVVGAISVHIAVEGLRVVASGPIRFAMTLEVRSDG